jgi:hypothetical protein
VQKRKSETGLQFVLQISVGCGTVTIFTVPVPTFDKVTVLVTVTVTDPYVDHKKHSFQNKFWKKACLFT